jgi:hypothetical protein
MLSIFNDEITTLESQLNALTQRINHLREAEAKAQTATATLTDLINTVSPLGKLNDIKRLVLNLFTDDNGGKEPTPSQPTDNSGSGLKELLPAETLTPSVEGEYAELVKVNDAVGYFKKYDGQILSTYVGGNNKARLNSWGQFLAIRHTFGCGFEVRLAKRLAFFGWKHELKLHGTNIDAINWIASQDLSKSPPSDGIEEYRRPLPPAYTKPTHSFRLNGEAVYQGTEEECRQRYEHAIANQDTRFAKLIDNRDYSTIQEFDRDKLETPQKAKLSVSFQIGDPVLITTESRCPEFNNLTGFVTAVSTIGATVEVNGSKKWFHADELTLICDTIQPPAESPKYSFIDVGSDNIYSGYQAYEGDRCIGKVEQFAPHAGWTFKGSSQEYQTREAAAAALDAKRQADKATHERMNAGILQRFQEAS